MMKSSQGTLEPALTKYPRASGARGLAGGSYERPKSAPGMMSGCASLQSTWKRSGAPGSFGGGASWQCLGVCPLDSTSAWRGCSRGKCWKGPKGPVGPREGQFHRPSSPTSPEPLQPQVSYSQVTNAPDTAYSSSVFEYKVLVKKIRQKVTRLLSIFPPNFCPTKVLVFGCFLTETSIWLCKTWNSILKG